MSLSRYLSVLQARFDRLALRPPAPATAVEVALLQQQHAATWAALMAWCHDGAGPGNSPAWAPGAKPAVAQRLAMASLRGPNAAILLAFANAFARQLDGSTQLDALPGGAAGLALRLGVKARDAQWWRQRQPSDPWDAGWAINTPPAQRQMQGRFMPRRATLILGDRQEFEALRLSLATLTLRGADFRHPVRWLWVGGDDDLPAPKGFLMTRLALA